MLDALVNAKRPERGRALRKKGEENVPGSISIADQTQNGSTIYSSSISTTTVSGVLTPTGGTFVSSSKSYYDAAGEVIGRRKRTRFDFRSQPDRERLDHLQFQHQHHDRERRADANRGHVRLFQQELL